MAKNIGTVTLTTGTVDGAARFVASQDGRMILHATTLDGLKVALKGAGLTGVLKRGTHAPLFEHDCPCCTFLGHEAAHDHYRCGGTLISRTSDEPSDNHSMPVDIAPMLVAQAPASMAWMHAAWRLHKARA